MCGVILNMVGCGFRTTVDPYDATFVVIYWAMIFKPMPSFSRIYDCLKLFGSIRSYII